MRGSRTHQKGRETQVTSSVRERSYTNKKEALVLKRQARASLANFLSQYLTFQSVLAFLDVDPKKYTEQGTLFSAQFSSWKRVPKSSSSPGTETGPRFWLSSSNVHLRACALKPSSGHFSDPYSGAPLSTKLLQALQAGCWLGGSNAQPQKHQRPATFLSSMAPSGSIRPA